jgi:AcrR family transcriptional regulator
MQIIPIHSTKAIPAGKRAQAKAQNRRIILEAAQRVFAEKGYGAANVRDIIRATPLASGTFYNYFRSKEEVFQALCDEAARTVEPVIRDARKQANSAEAFFLGSFGAFFRFVAHTRANGINSAPLPMQPSAFRVSELKREIEVAIAGGVLPAVNPQILASAMWGLAAGLAESLPEWSDIEGAARSATIFMLSGLQAFVVEPKAAVVNF